MSKSFGNVIGITEPAEEMFGKLMSIRDDLIIQYFELASDKTAAEIKEIQERLNEGENPRNIKFELATAVTTLYHGEEAAKKVGEEFDRVFAKRELPTDMPEFKNVTGQNIVDFIATANLAASKSEARRLIEQKAVKLNDQIIDNINAEIEEGILQVGKRRFAKIV